MKTLLLKLLGISQPLLDFFMPLLTRQIGDSLSRLLPIALEIVAELATKKNLTNAEKRAAAVNRLTSEIKVEGIAATNSLINFAIEAAVQKLKSK